MKIGSLKNTGTTLLLGICLVSCGQSVKTENKDTMGTLPIADSTLSGKPNNYWREHLNEDQFYVLREKGTESPFTGKWLMHKDTGYYTCVACGNPLFNADRKFDAHCGWPSFDEEIEGGRIKTKMDYTHGMSRLEIMCGNCGGHLGHLFDDGPTSTGKRYCVNSISLDFVKAENINPSHYDTITLGGGCFWCVEAVFLKLQGVIKVESGYSGGKTINPTYKDVSSGTTGHAEVIQIVFDPKQTNLDEIFKVFFTIHDPTTLNRQGADEGTQYRSVIYYRNNEQKVAAESIISELSKASVYDAPIVTKVEPFDKFYKAEDYHQNYYENNISQGYCQMVIQPKIEKFEKVFKDRVKK